MKNVSTIQEILLITTTTFSKKQLCEINSQESNRYLLPTAQLEEACWNGLVNELLPELTQTPAGSERVFLWKVETRNSCIKISLGSSFPVLEKEHCLDPYIFLNSREMN